MTRPRQNRGALLRRAPRCRAPVERQTAMAALVIGEPADKAGFDGTAPATVRHRGGVPVAEGGADHDGSMCQVLSPQWFVPTGVRRLLRRHKPERALLERAVLDWALHLMGSSEVEEEALPLGWSARCVAWGPLPSRRASRHVLGACISQTATAEPRNPDSIRTTPSGCGLAITGRAASDRVRSVRFACVAKESCATEAI
jgi:hypothetical protein